MLRLRLRTRFLHLLRTLLAGSGIALVKLPRRIPGFFPHSPAGFLTQVDITIGAVNQTPQLLERLSQRLIRPVASLQSLEDFAAAETSVSDVKLLRELFDRYGSDKGVRHNYENIYGRLFKDRSTVKRVLEIGLGTNNVDVPSNMGADGKPGASLRAFRDYFQAAEVYGADVDRRILFSETRIQTFFVDQTSDLAVGSLLSQLPTSFDLIIDDGLHATHTNLRTLLFGLDLVSIGGWVVIEDINPDSEEIWRLVWNMLGPDFEPHLLAAPFGLVFAVNRIGT